MAKKIDWDSVRRKQSAQRHGSGYAFDELPPTGSYADKMRYFSAKGKTTSPTARAHAKPQAKSKPSSEESLHILRKNLRELLAIPNTLRWYKNGPIYQRRLLVHIKNTLNKLLKLEPSVSTEACVVQAKQLLAQHSSSGNEKK